MRCHLIAVGKGPKQAVERTLFETYAGRLSAPFSLGLREVEEKKRLSGQELKEREADLLLAAVPDGAAVIALDERGKALGSRDFADKIALWRDTGTRDVAFLIGGADGLGEAARTRADRTLRLSSLTLTHEMARLLLAEQVYRGLTILRGMPYHRA